MISRLLTLGASIFAVACGLPTESLELDGSTATDAVATDAEIDADAGLTVDADAGVLSSGQFDLNDVSFLFPLPTEPSGRDRLLVVADPSHPRGALLPEVLSVQLPEPLSNFPQSEIVDLRVVSVRVDHCFRGQPSEACRRQVRLVAQPVLAQDATKTVDASAHLFYDLAQDEFVLLIERLRVLRVLANGRTEGRALGVHPVMDEEGLDGAYASELKRLVRDFCGEDNISRVALMRLLRPGSAWRFEAFDVSGDQLRADEVPRIEPETGQDFSLSDTAPDTGFFGPAPADSALPLLFDFAALSSAPVPDIERAVIESHRIENPNLELPSTVDCVSCHVADRGRVQARVVRSVIRDDAPERYSNEGYDLTRLSDQAGLSSQRAFGYFEQSPSLAQRVVNESAEVARSLEGF